MYIFKSCIASERVPVGRWRCLLFVMWMNIGSIPFNDFSFAIIQPVLNLVLLLIFNIKLKLLGCKEFLVHFLQIFKCVIWMTVTLVGKYLNYAFLIVSPDIWFYVVI